MTLVLPPHLVTVTLCPLYIVTQRELLLSIWFAMDDNTAILLSKLFTQVDQMANSVRALRESFEVLTLAIQDVCPEWFAGTSGSDISSGSDTDVLSEAMDEDESRNMPPAKRPKRAV